MQQAILKRDLKNLSFNLPVDKLVYNTHCTRDCNTDLASKSYIQITKTKQQE